MKVNYRMSATPPWTAKDAPPGRGRARRRRRRRDRPLVGRPRDAYRAGEPVRPGRTDDDRRPDAVAGRHRGAVALHAPAPRHHRRRLGRRPRRTVRGHARPVCAGLAGPRHRPVGAAAVGPVRGGRQPRRRRRSTAGRRSCTSSCSSDRSPGSVARGRRSTGSTSAAQRATRAAGCTGRAGTSRPGRPCWTTPGGVDPEPPRRSACAAASSSDRRRPRCRHVRR